MMTQPVYNVYRGQGFHAHMTYRVIPGADDSQFHMGSSGWENSLVNEKTVRNAFPLVAKNVRFK